MPLRLMLSVTGVLNTDGSIVLSVLKLTVMSPVKAERVATGSKASRCILYVMASVVVADQILPLSIWVFT